MKRSARYAFVLMTTCAVVLALIAFGCARALARRERVMRDDADHVSPRVDRHT